MEMRIQNTNECPNCGEVDTIPHFFLNCIKVKLFWDDVKRLICVKLNKQIRLTEGDILTGIDKTYSTTLNGREIRWINHVILIAKMTIGRYRYGKGHNLKITFENECIFRKIIFN